MRYEVDVVTSDSSFIPDDFRRLFDSIRPTAATRMTVTLDADDDLGAIAMTEMAIDAYGLNGYARSAK